MRSKSHCCVKKLTITKIKRPPSLTWYVQTCSTTWQKGFHHRNFRVKNRRCAWEQWSFPPTILALYSFSDMNARERSGIASTGDSLLLKPHNWYADRNASSLYQNIPTSCTQGLLKAVIQLSCLCNSWPLCMGFYQAPTGTAGLHSRAGDRPQTATPFMRGTVQSPGCKSFG